MHEHEQDDKGRHKELRGRHFRLLFMAAPTAAPAPPHFSIYKQNLSARHSVPFVVEWH